VRCYWLAGKAMGARIKAGDNDSPFPRFTIMGVVKAVEPFELGRQAQIPFGRQQPLDDLIRTENSTVRFLRTSS
jgi:hypothetical protein